MKKLSIIVVLAAALISACTQSNTSNEGAQEVLSAAVPVTYYGEKINDEATVEASRIPDLLQEKDTVSVKVAGKIIQTCRKKGCWMTIDIGNNEKMTVKFKDYGFFVPLDADGVDAIFEGFAFKTEKSVAELRHLAEDAGKSEEEIAAITQPEVAYSFEASGVILKGYEPKTKTEE
jgi:hypothetical protein